ncbi:Uncharacterised protein [Mycobacterium tuberculosis]|nr:Uncharacterised protein [Mycobacterium tuberculosis]
MRYRNVRQDPHGRSEHRRAAELNPVVQQGGADGRGVVFSDGVSGGDGADALGGVADLARYPTEHPGGLVAPGSVRLVVYRNRHGGHQRGLGQHAVLE